MLRKIVFSLAIIKSQKHPLKKSGYIFNFTHLCDAGQFVNVKHSLQSVFLAGVGMSSLLASCKKHSSFRTVCNESVDIEIAQLKNKKTMIARKKKRTE